MNRFVAVLSLALLAGCSTSNHAPKMVAAATPDQEAALINRVKALQGTWVVPAEGKNPGGEIVFAVTSNGSAVREIMLPGSPMEMTNIYHMDGPSLVMTHYCAIGNQPRMRAMPCGPNDPIALKFDSVTNLSRPDETYMGGMTLVIKDHNHIEERWTSYKGGAAEGEHAVFELTRKQ